MTRSFGNAAARAAWQRRFLKNMPNEVMKIAQRKLLQLHNAQDLDDSRP